MALGFVCTALTMRLLIDHYGAAAFASISLVSTIVGLIPFADLGLGTALTNLVIRARFGEDGELLRPALVSTTAILAGVALVLLIVGGVWSYAGWPAIAALKVLGSAGVVMPAIAAVLGVWLIGGPAFRVLNGLGRTTTVVLIQACSSPMSLALTYGAVAMGCGPLIPAVIPILSMAAVSGIGWLLVVRALRQPGFLPLAATPRRARLVVLRRLLHEGAAASVLVLGTALLLQSDRVILAAFGEERLLVEFAVVLPAFGAIQSLLSAFGAYLWPHYVADKGTGDLSLHELDRATRVAVGAGGLLALGFVGLMPAYVWLVGFDQVPWAVVVPLAALIAVQAATLPRTSVLSDSETIQKIAVVGLSVGAAKILAAALIIHAVGFGNPAIASVLAVSLIGWPAYRYLCRTVLPST